MKTYEFLHENKLTLPQVLKNYFYINVLHFSFAPSEARYMISEYCLKAWKFVVLNYGYGLIILIIDVISRKNNITIVIFGYLLATYGSILDSLSFFYNCIEQVKVWLCSKSEANLFDGRCKSLIPNDMVKLIQCRI